MVKKVLACCAFGDADKDTLIEFTKHLKNQDYKSLDITFVDFSENQTLSNELRKTGAAVIPLNKNLNSSQSKLKARQILREISLKNNYEFTLFLEPGILLPKNAITKLIKNNKDICSGTYLHITTIDNKKEVSPVLYLPIDKDSVRAIELWEVLNKNTIPIAASGLGCTLIKNTVLKKIEFRFLKNNSMDDIAFYFDAKNANFKAFADTGVKCNFLIKEKENKFNDFLNFDIYPQIRNPKVLLACVTYEKDKIYLNEFMNAINKLDYYNIDLLFIDNSDSDDYTKDLEKTGAKVIKDNKKSDTKIEKITNSRELARKYAIDKKYDNLLFVDTDVIIPKNTVSKLLANRRDVIAGIVLSSMNVNGIIKVRPNIYGFSDEKEFCVPADINTVLPNKQYEVACGGFGCTMTTTKVLKQVKLRYYDKSKAGEDIAFFVDARKKGFTTWADTSIKCKHLVYPPGDSRNRKFDFNNYLKKNNTNNSINIGIEQ